MRCKKFHTIICAIILAALTAPSFIAIAPSFSADNAGGFIAKTEGPFPTPSVSSQGGKAGGGDTPSSILFIQNVGQFEEEVRFKTWGSSSTAFLTDNAIWFVLLEQASGKARNWFGESIVPHEEFLRDEPRKGVALRVTFPGSNPNLRLEPFQRLKTSVSYFIGNDPARWRTNVPVYAGVRYVDLYPGIDLEVTTEAGRWAWQVVCRANCQSALQNARLRVEGAESIDIGNGVLRISTTLGDFTLPLLKAVSADGVPLTGIRGETVAYTDEILFPFTSTSGPFSLPASQTINPFTSQHQDSSDLIYATFLGGSKDDCGEAIAVDSLGAAYVTGGTWSPDFPITPGAFDTTCGTDGNCNYDGLHYHKDAFVAKLNPSGSDILYATFLGGSWFDYGEAIAVDASGVAYVTGWTDSSDFPVTSGAFDTSHNGWYDVFVVKLSPSGDSLTYATFLGGGNWDLGYDIALDSYGAIYVTGYAGSSNFPTTPNAFDTTYNGVYDVFVVKLTPYGNSLSYATFLGGSDNDKGLSIAVDSSGAAYVTGLTKSSDFPTTSDAFDTSYNGGYWDAFVVKLDPSGSNLVYATFLGGSSSEGGRDIAVDSSGAAFVAGWTKSPDFPTTSGAFDISHNGGYDAFMVELNPYGSGPSYASFLGGNGDDRSYAIAVDAYGSAYLVGWTDSYNFPTTSNAFDTDYNGEDDAFVVKLNPHNDDLLYATFLGGSSDDGGNGIFVDSSGTVYVTGKTTSYDFPTTPGAFDRSYAGGTCGVEPFTYPCPDSFIAKLAVSKYSIRGRVIDVNGDPFPGVTIHMNSDVSVTTDASGAYTITNLLAGTYILTPTLTGYIFYPPARTVTLPPDASGQNFTILPEPVSANLSPDTSVTLVLTDTQGLTTVLTFPAGAVTQTTTVVLTPTVASGGAGLAFAGHTFELKAFRDGDSLPGFGFEVPITVTIHYSDRNVRVIKDESQLALMRWTGNGWEDAANTCMPPSTYIRDLENNVLSVAICHLSKFALLGPTNQVYLPLVMKRG